MRNFTIYLAVALCTIASKLTAQESFESKAKSIAEQIEKVTKDEKEALKVAVEAVNVRVEKGEINAQQAAQEKEALAKKSVAKLETEVNRLNDELRNLVQDKVDGKIAAQDSTKSKHRFYISYEKGKKGRKKLESNGEKRTTTQFVYALGANNLVTDGSIHDSELSYTQSRFYEVGYTYNTRVFKNDNFLHLKYGASLMYNDLVPTDNRIFQDQGRQTVLVDSPVELKRGKLRNVYFVAPVHFEFDFTKKKQKDDKTQFTTHDSFRIGIGGYTGFRVKTKQKLIYELDDYRHKEVTRGNFNASDFIYGVSAYVGYRNTSLYLKYDLNPVFKNNDVKQNNISLGLRFDIN